MGSPRSKYHVARAHSIPRASNLDNSDGRNYKSGHPIPIPEERLKKPLLKIVVVLAAAAVFAAAAQEKKPFNGLNMGLQSLSRLSHAQTRSISPENFTGEKGKAGMSTDGPAKGSARDLGQGWKLSP